MKIKITSQKTNPLLKRREVTFEIEHSDQGSTPTRLEVRKTLAAELTVEIDNVYIKRLETKRGTTSTRGTANIYDSPQHAKLSEPKYIIERNNPAEKKKEETAAKPEQKTEQKEEETKP